MMSNTDLYLRTQLLVLNFMVEMFIKHVLGVGQEHPGLYGKAAYMVLLSNKGDCLCIFTCCSGF